MAGLCDELAEADLTAAFVYLMERLDTGLGMDGWNDSLRNDTYSFGGILFMSIVTDSIYISSAKQCRWRKMLKQLEVCYPIRRSQPVKAHDQLSLQTKNPQSRQQPGLEDTQLKSREINDPREYF